MLSTSVCVSALFFALEFLIPRVSGNIWLLSGISEIDEARYIAKLRLIDQTYVDSFRVDAAQWTLKANSHDEILIDILSQDMSLGLQNREP